MDEAHDTGAGRPADDRPRGVPKAKLADINTDSKISIFYRPRHGAPMTPVQTSFPKDAATIFCDRIRTVLQDGHERAYIITGGTETAYQMIFNWIKTCIELQSIEKFPEIPEPDDDPFQPTIDVIVAGKNLGVPEGSLAYHLKKRLIGCARKHLMSFDQVRRFYTATTEPYQLGLKDVACASVFNAWWDARLDASVNPELMEELYDMRQENEELDQDLHDACQTRREEIEKKWAEKKAKKEAERAEQTAEQTTGGDGWSGGSDFQGQGHSPNEQQWQNGVSADPAGNWNTGADDATFASHFDNNVAGSWDTENTPLNQDVSQGWDQTEKTVASMTTDNFTDSPAVEDWADEMNEIMQNTPSVAPAMQW